MDQKIYEHIKAKLTLVPKLPGCYQMKNSDNVIIYVGKAKVLQNRLKSYFSGSHDAKTTRMIQDVVDFEYIITTSEAEAFLLECNFIKEHRPKYNILMMDDKSYPYICLTTEEHPRLIMTRDVSKYKRRVDFNNQKIFGPFPNVNACRDMVEILNKLFPLRKCHQIPKKSCIYYDIHQCLAPCINKVSKEDYEPYISNLIKFLSGNTTDLIKSLEIKMEEASSQMDYELALTYRNLITSIESLQSKQTMDFSDGISRDIFGFFEKDSIVAIQVLHMRLGKIIERTGQVFDVYDNIEELLLYYIYHFYDNNPLPNEILIPYIEGYQVLTDLLPRKVRVPIKGTKKKLVQLVCDNAQNNLDNLQKLRLLKISKTKEPIVELGKLLNIPYPEVIELFDNSNIQGSNAVSAMVTYIDGNPSLKDYRKYKIKTVNIADDYHTMQEVITRRYTRVIKDNLRKPNLIIVDGGKTQVKAALIVLHKLAITDIAVMGLVKDDNHKTRAIMTSNYEEISLDKKSNLYLLLEAMQDEVHRFAITFFQQTISKNAISSILDSIEGIGPARKKILLVNFDSLDDIKNASDEKLKSLGFNEKLIKNIKERLNNRDQ